MKSLMFENKATQLLVLKIWARQVRSTNPQLLAGMGAVTLKHGLGEFVLQKHHANPSCQSFFYVSPERQSYGHWLCESLFASARWAGWAVGVP